MKDSTKGTLTVFALVLGVGLMCGIFGFVAGIERGKNKSVERLLSIEKRLDLHDRIDSVLAASVNAFYEYVGVKGKIGSVKQDTAQAVKGDYVDSTSIDLLWPPLMGSDPIPPPAGFEAIIERSVFQNLIKPRVVDTAQEER